MEMNDRAKAYKKYLLDSTAYQVLQVGPTFSDPLSVTIQDTKMS